MKNMLTVDWDFFFPSPEGKPTLTLSELSEYDWGHQETGLFMHPMIWEQRASVFLANKHKLPDSVFAGDIAKMKTWWTRFRFARNARLFVSESHCDAVKIAEKHSPSRIVNFDAHHDCGYNKSLDAKHITCEDWLAAAVKLLDIPATVVYPRWKEWAMTCEPRPKIPVKRKFDSPSLPFPEFHVVHVCRSGAWTPTWLDEQFDQFVTASGLLHVNPLKPRGFSLENSEKHAEIIRQMTESMHAHVGSSPAGARTQT